MHTVGSSGGYDIDTEMVTVGPMAHGPRDLAGTRLPLEAEEHGGEAEAAEARRRISEFMESHDVVFNGAGEADLPNVAQAWSVRHTKPARMRQNLETLRGVAAILLQYPQLRCEVHGETGRAQSVPPRLAQHLGITDPVRDVAKGMDVLAQLRAQACLDALVVEGVPESQLYVTFRGMGGHLHIEFLPRAQTSTFAGGRESGTAKNALHATPGDAAERDVQAVAFKLMRGTENDCFVCIDDDADAEYEPFIKSLQDLLLGARDLGDGALDVPLRLVPKDGEVRERQQAERARHGRDERERAAREEEQLQELKFARQVEATRRRPEETLHREETEATRRQREVSLRQRSQATDVGLRQWHDEDARRRQHDGPPARATTLPLMQTEDDGTNYVGASIHIDDGSDAIPKAHHTSAPRPLGSADMRQPSPGKQARRWEPQPRQPVPSSQLEDEYNLGNTEDDGADM